MQALFSVFAASSFEPGERFVFAGKGFLAF
jgi:hypothetical protein